MGMFLATALVAWTHITSPKKMQQQFCKNGALSEEAKVVCTYMIAPPEMLRGGEFTLAKDNAARSTPARIVSQLPTRASMRVQILLTQQRMSSEDRLLAIDYDIQILSAKTTCRED